MTLTLTPKTPNPKPHMQASFGFQVLIFIPCAIFQTEKFYDLTGSITFFGLSITSILVGSKVDFDQPIFDQLKTRQIVLNCFVIVWCCRLGSFLFVRIIHDGGVDRRFDGVREIPVRFFSFWMFQGLWVVLTALPVWTLNAYGSSEDPDPALGPVDYIAWGLWATGFLIEVIADRQKSAFAARKTGKWIDEGLWHYSRHPNYFGEIMLWCGVCFGSTPILKDSQWAVFISPIFAWFLLARVSGVPLTERRSDKKWGDQLEYQLYMANTSPIMLWSKGDKTEEDEDVKTALMTAQQKTTAM